MKGIPFSPPMAVASLRDVNPKIQTRRLLNPQPIPEATSVTHFRGREWHAQMPDPEIAGLTLHLGKHLCEYQTGERRCMLATWAVMSELDARKPSEMPTSVVEAGGFWHAGMGPKPEWAGKSRPGRFLPNHLRHLMPVFTIGDIRAERLQVITKADALLEGLESVPGTYSGQTFWKNYGMGNFLGYLTPIDSYRTLWEQLNGPGSWALNPWVWVISFRRVA